MMSESVAYLEEPRDPPDLSVRPPKEHVLTRAIMREREKKKGRWFQPLHPAEMAAQAAFLGLGATDWGQTVRFTDPAYRNAHPRTFESNPILGKHPSRAKVNTLIPLALAAHTLGVWALPRPYRNILQAVGIGLETDAVIHNDMKPEWPWK